MVQTMQQELTLLTFLRFHGEPGTRPTPVGFELAATCETPACSRARSGSCSTTFLPSGHVDCLCFCWHGAQYEGDAACSSSSSSGSDVGTSSSLSICHGWIAWSDGSRFYFLDPEMQQPSLEYVESREQDGKGICKQDGRPQVAAWPSWTPDV